MTPLLSPTQLLKSKPLGYPESPLGNKDLAESNQWTTEEGKTQQGWRQNRNQGKKCQRIKKKISWETANALSFGKTDAPVESLW